VPILPDVSLTELVLIVGLAAFSGIAGGVAGYGTGALMPLVLVPILGAAPVVPIIAVSAMFTNSARIVAFRRALNLRRAVIALVAAAPTCVLGAWLYTLLTGRGAALVIGVSLIATVPLRRILKNSGRHLGETGFAAAAAGWGVLVGGTTGAGVVLLSLLMATGLEGAAVIATDATVSIVMGVVKLSVFGLAGALAVYFVLQEDSPMAIALYVPLFKQVAIPLGVAFVVLGYFIVVGFSNAVNLTDGLDGLAIMPTVLVSAALGVFAYAAGHSVFSTYLQIPSVPGAAELCIFCGALSGAGLGFLWFNAYPAQVFMGDVGALALGAALGTLAVIVRQEIVLFIMGGVFVMETLSVILQVASFKLTGKRIFRMAPLHHHFELKGWPEPRVIVRFWIITVILVLVGLSTLKVR